MPVILLAHCHNIAIIILGTIMSLFFIDTPSKIRGDNCGYWPINIENLTSSGDDTTHKFLLGQLAQLVSTGTAAPKTYVYSCYGPEASLSTCDIMINRQIPWAGINNASCPFAVVQCVEGENGVFMVDTGNVTAKHYEINTGSSFMMWRQSVRR
jgi:hypothetical protein